ncbi:MAG: LutB/LldF family L-lactate oxidation iron-sulfur protein [Acidobacteriota bacterium]|nr:LutB/LldF family L-lactate oxidation iron-sulfur protein [Acidobacteriota bacterium]
MRVTSPGFKANAGRALTDPQLQKALKRLKGGFQVARLKAAEQLPEFEALRDQAREIKDFTLAHLDFYLELFEERVGFAGGKVHWAANASAAREIVLDICREAGAKKILKGKSMVTEEIGLNDHLEAHGLQVIETDLGEYIIQLRKEPPSHIIAPAIHVSKDQVSEDFRKHHTDLEPKRPLEEPRELLDEARQILREHFLTADVGITGANFLVAASGSSVIVTNEGNGDLTQTLAKTHIVVASIEKVVPTMEDCATLLRVLSRSATGQELSVYTTFSTGPRRAGDPDGPVDYHVVLLDNGRTQLLGNEFREVLRCIRCGSCMNSCPVYGAVGGHAYGWVYPGPIGAVLTPALVGVEKAWHLPSASSFCGKCEEVCPVRIPLPKLMRHWRERAFEAGKAPATQRFGLKIWSLFARRPGLYRLATRLASRLLRMLGRKRGSLSKLPLAGGWTSERDLPVPPGPTFSDLYHRRKS